MVGQIPKRSDLFDIRYAIRLRFEIRPSLYVGIRRWEASNGTNYQQSLALTKLTAIAGSINWTYAHNPHQCFWCYSANMHGPTLWAMLRRGICCKSWRSKTLNLHFAKFKNHSRSSNRERESRGFSWCWSANPSVSGRPTTAFVDALRLSVPAHESVDQHAASRKPVSQWNLSCPIVWRP